MQLVHLNLVLVLLLLVLNHGTLLLKHGGIHSAILVVALLHAGVHHVRPVLVVELSQFKKQQMFDEHHL